MQVPLELKRKYIQRRFQDVQQILISLDENDFGPAVRIGHQLKGNAQTFDFPQLAPLGVQIEKAAIAKDKQTLKELIELMDREVTLASRLFLH
jgi:HPt (histidine-containing phosphotransfer) domain-containing protein